MVLLLGLALDAAGVAAEAKAPPWDTRGKEDDLPTPDVLDASTCWAIVALVGREEDEQDE